MAMGRVREHEVGGGARLLATALSSGVLLVGILGWMVAVGTMASPGGRFGENVLAPSAAYPSLGAAASDAGAYGSRAGEGAMGGSRGRPNDALDDTNVRRRNRPGEGAYAEDSARDRWLAFTEPVEMARISRWGEKVATRGPVFAVAGSGLAFLAILGSLAALRRERAGPTP